MRQETSDVERARTKRGWTAPLLGGLLAVAASISVASPTSAAVTTAEKPIQPGAAIQMYPGPAYPKAAPRGTCTLNFVFRDVESKSVPAHGRRAPGVYIGTAGHCVSGLTEGARVATPTTGDFGTIAYLVSCRMTPCEGRPIFDDFALVRVDDDKVGLVSPVMRGFGKAPSDYTRSDETSTGDLVVLRTQASPFSLTEPTSTQTGVLEGDDAVAFGTTLVGPSNSGSPVVRQSDGKALGIVAAYRGASMLQGTAAELNEPPLQGGPTVEHIMDLLAGEGGLDVRLATSEEDLRDSGQKPAVDRRDPKDVASSRDTTTTDTPAAAPTAPAGETPRLAGASGATGGAQFLGFQSGRASTVLARTGAPVGLLVVIALGLLGSGTALRGVAR